MFKTWISYLEKKIVYASGKTYRPGFFSFEQLLVIVSWIYRICVRLRMSLYRFGFLKSRKLPCFVVSIGNIMAGGAGKTPMAVYVADTLIHLGYRPVVVSRGYKGDVGKTPAIVGDGCRVFMDAAAAGDEPFMMARQKRFPVVVGKSRYAAGRLALDELNVNAVVLDDGFQHLALARDLDLVLFDHNRPLGNGRMLPAGRLRETPAMARKRIHALILTRCPDGQGNMPVSLARKIGENNPPVFYTGHSPVLAGFVSQDSKKGGGKDLGWLKNRRALLFSGIARNDSFRDTVSRLGVTVLSHLEFSDHYMYKRSDFRAIRDRARVMDADLILTTEKDWVKADSDFHWGRDVGIIGISIEMKTPGEFGRFLKEKYDDR